jgi:SAM-dependent methyltransferase
VVLPMIQDNNKLLSVDICPICGGNDCIVISDSPNRIIQCKVCSFSYRSPKPNINELHTYYSSAQTSTHAIDQKLRNLQAIQRLKQLIRRIDFSKIHSILEVGCDDGVFLHIVKERFPDMEIFGIEPSQTRAESARRLYGLTNVITEPFEKASLNRTFDLITGFHVLEHVADPIIFFEKISRLMTPGSFLCLEVPTVSLSRFDLPFGKKLLAPGYTQSPEHLWFFVPQTYRHLLERCGFHIVLIKCVTFGVHPKVNSFVMRRATNLFPFYRLMSDVILFPFNASGNGLQVMAIATRNVK